MLAERTLLVDVVGRKPLFTGRPYFCQNPSHAVCHEKSGDYRIISPSARSTVGMFFATGIDPHGAERDFTGTTHGAVAGYGGMSGLLDGLGSQHPHPRIAIIRALQLGDVLCAVPAWRAMRKAWPQAHMTFVGLPWAKEFTQRFDHLFDDFREFPGFPGIPEHAWDEERYAEFCRQSREDPFDLVIQMHGSGWDINGFALQIGGRHTAGFYPATGACPDPTTFLRYPDDVSEVERHLQLAEFLGAPREGDHLEFPMTEQDHDQFLALVSQTGLTVGRYICVHPGARWPSRRWPAARYAEVADRLVNLGYQVLLTGSAAETELAENVSQRMHQPHINLVGRTELGVTVRLLADARLLVSNDTGISHLAASVGTPSVVVVLGSDPERWAPLDKQRHQVVLHPVDCRPCEHFICPIDHHCATHLSPQRVFEAAQSMLHRDFAARDKITDPTPLSTANTLLAFQH